MLLTTRWVTQPLLMFDSCNKQSKENLSPLSQRLQYHILHMVYVAISLVMWLEVEIVYNKHDFADWTLSRTYQYMLAQDAACEVLPLKTIKFACPMMKNTAKWHPNIAQVGRKCSVLQPVTGNGLVEHVHCYLLEEQLTVVDNYYQMELKQWSDPCCNQGTGEACDITDYPKVTASKHHENLHCPCCTEWPCFRNTIHYNRSA